MNPYESRAYLAENVIHIERGFIMLELVGFVVVIWAIVYYLNNMAP